MGTLVKKIKQKRPYWYYVESARIEGNPRIIRQVYLGTAESVVNGLVAKNRPQPLKGTAMPFGLPGALWLAAQDSGIWDCLSAIWPQKGRKPSVAHYILLAAIHRICNPGPKTEVAQWYAGSVLQRAWHFRTERFTSQAFWDTFTSIDQDSPFPDDELTRAQMAITARWKESSLITDSILAYDTTNFYTYIDSRNDRCSLAKRGKNKQKRSDLRQVGLACLVDGSSGLGLYHHAYPGNRSDMEQFAVSLPRILSYLEHAGIRRENVTLVFDKGASDLVNIAQIEEAGIGWVAPVSWSEVPTGMQNVKDKRMTGCSSKLPGFRVFSKTCNLWGANRLCVLSHSSTFEAEQMHSLMDSVAKAVAALRSLSRELASTHTRPRVAKGIARRIGQILSGQWLKKIILIDALVPSDNGLRWGLQFHVDNTAMLEIIQRRMGRTVLATNRGNWTAEQILEAYHGQSRVEMEFRGVKAGVACEWGPMFHWTDGKIIIHAFYTMLGMSLLNWMRLKLRSENVSLSREQMIHELEQMQEIAVVYPKEGKEKGPKPTARLITHSSLDQRMLSRILGLDRLAPQAQG